jgi:hypothetical protein
MANSSRSSRIARVKSTVSSGSSAQVTDTLTPVQVYRSAVDLCQPNLDFHPVGKVTVMILVTVWFAAPARISSISETGLRLLV